MSVIGPPLLPDELEANARVKVRTGSTEMARRALRLIGSGVSIALVDDSINEEVEITVTTTGAPPTGAAGGDLTGTYPDPTLAADSVDSAEIVDGAVDTVHLGDLQVTTGKLAADAVTAAKHSPTLPLPHSRTARLVFTGTRTTTSSSFSNFGTDVCQIVDFVKHRADTFLSAESALGAYGVTNFATLEVAAQVDGTDYVLMRTNLNTSVVSHPSGAREIPDIPAGTYTITLRWRRAALTGTITTDPAEQTHLTITETF